MENLPRQEYYNKAGIYCIYSTVNDKIYIGSSTNLYRRVNYHIKKLEKVKHDNEHLQLHYNKYGKCSLEIAVLEVFENISRDDLLNLEQKYLNSLKFVWANCFNICTKAKSAGIIDPIIASKASTDNWKNNRGKMLEIVRNNIKKAHAFIKHPDGKHWIGRKHREESKLKMSASAKIRDRNVSRSVIMYSKKGEELKEFPAIIDAVRFLGGRATSATNISAVCLGKRKYAFGYKWGYGPSKKLRELLENPEEDDQQPSLDGNIFEGSETRSESINNG